MHPDLIDMIRYASAKKRSVNFTTNATLLPEKTAALLDSGLDAIAFSFPETRQFSPLISKNAAAFIRQRKARQTKLPKTHLNIALFPGDFTTVDEGFRLAKTTGIDVVNFERSFPWTHDQAKSESLLFSRIRSTARRAGCHVKLPVPHTHSCLLNQLTLFVRWNGDVAPCCYRADVILGNVLQEDLQDILDKRVKFQKTMKADPVCGICRV